MIKPTMKMVWKGVKGNKWRAYDVVNSEGYSMHFQNKADALRVLNASKQVYKILSKKKGVK